MLMLADLLYIVVGILYNICVCMYQKWIPILCKVNGQLSNLIESNVYILNAICTSAVLEQKKKIVVAIL